MNAALALEGKGITVRVSDRSLLHDVDVKITGGQVTAVVGPNGAGKSTLLRVMAGDLVPSGGVVSMDDRALSHWTLSERALRRAVLPQRSTLSFSLPVRAVVELGRMPSSGRRGLRHERGLVDQALKQVDAFHLQHRAYPTLSGGERQRVHLARVLVQIADNPTSGGRYLLLDEPLSAQDLGRQHLVMKLLRDVAETGVGVFVVMHDVNIAARYADELLVLHNGVRVATGCPARMLTPELIRSAFGLHVTVMRDPHSNVPVVLPVNDPGHLSEGDWSPLSDAPA